MKRCGWVNDKNPLYIKYHDEEWGQPLHQDQPLFELLCLETYQAGLSWELILNKRANFRNAFYNFEVKKVARMSDLELDNLLENSKIIRNKRKIYATRANAQAFEKVQHEFGSFEKYIWHFVNFRTINNSVESYQDAPAKTPLSEKISKDMKKRGFKFVGPVVVYSFIQSAGLINDHENNCAWKKVAR